MTVLMEKKYAVAGCTIIALAQLLNYHKFFNKKDYYFGAINSYLNSMETNPPKDTTNSMYASEFIKDISTNETLGTYLKWHSSVYVYIKSIPKFLNKVGYDAHIGKFNFDKIKKYLSRGNPVIMTAETIEGHSHVWVVDGYRDYHKKGLSNDHYSYLHMNWGWGVNYQNDEKDNGWHKVDKNGLVTYGNLILDQKVKTIYINR